MPTDDCNIEDKFKKQTTMCTEIKIIAKGLAYV